MTANMRAQVWVGRKFLSFGLTIISHIQDGSLMAMGNPDSYWSENNGSGAAMSGLLKPKITQLMEPRIDLSDMTVTTKMNFLVSGLVSINNDLEIDGVLLGEGAALTVATPVEAASKDSFLKSFSVLILIMPYADDVYMDLILRAKIFDLGTRSILPQVVGTALKVMIGKLLSIEG